MRRTAIFVSQGILKLKSIIYKVPDWAPSHSLPLFMGTMSSAQRKTDVMGLIKITIDYYANFSS